MLTGDKVETAKCIALSTGLIQRGQSFFEIIGIKKVEEIRLKLLEVRNTVVIIDGQSLGVILESVQREFILLATELPGVIFCRVSPTQKSQIVEALKKETIFRVCTIGDGGNDVGMIQSAHIGIGVEGKEGHQASLAADFSISEFKYLSDLIL